MFDEVRPFPKPPTMTIEEACLLVVAVLSAGYTAYTCVAVLRTILGVPLLERLSPPPPSKRPSSAQEKEEKEWPRVSVVVAACNEEDSIETAMRSRLTEDYPNAEYILVNDRSTDKTGEIIDRLANENEEDAQRRARVHAIHIRALPEGWLGKVHAMHVAMSKATGEWILFSDADVHHEPDALRRVIAYCEEKRIDHMALFPSVWSRSLWLDIVLNAFLRVFTVIARAWKVEDPKSKVAIGGGNFNLVRRTSFDRAFPDGLESLKLEVLDDIALGQMLKWSGARSGILNARGFVGLYFYRNVWDAVCGMEKNAFAGISRFNIGRFIIALVVMATFELGSLGVATLATGWIRYVAFAAMALGLVREVAMARWLGRPLFPSLFAPLGIVVMYFGAIRSMVLTVANNGVKWRGTHYPLEALRRGRRFLLV
jgi:glycosyltransferase involved in cell wall biosynthesis